MNVIECNCQWHFEIQSPRSQEIGPNNAAAEHFSATPYPSLIRESIQNSLDVVKDENLPVKMKFEFGKMRAKTYEAFYELKRHIEGVLSFYGSAAESEYRPMLEHFEKSYNNQNVLHYIKVSDYNTVGMDYIHGDNKSPLYAFLRAEGVTVKTNEFSGGSFGFGKSAYFMISPIHTVLVSTMTEDGKSFFEGAARLCTHLYKGKDGIEKNTNIMDITITRKENAQHLYPQIYQKSSNVMNLEPISILWEWMGIRIVRQMLTTR